MERAEGQSLDRVLASGRRFSRDELIHILKQVATALDYAHWSGVVHRDVKPANIIVDNWMNARIADFGIAKAISSPSQTVTAMAVGTPLYMSPEQVEALPSDGRSDQFSLAIVAFEILTGRRPFYGDTLASLAHRIVYSDRPSAREANPGLPAAVDAVFRRGLARFPKDRYATCSEFVGALTNALQEPLVAALRPPLPEPPRLEVAEPDGDTRKFWIIGAAVAAVLLAAWFYFMQPKEAPVTVGLDQGSAPAVQPGLSPKSNGGGARRKDKNPKPAETSNSATPSSVPNRPTLKRDPGRAGGPSVHSASEPTGTNGATLSPPTRGVVLSSEDPALVDDNEVSLSGNQPALIEFVNRSGRPVDIYWIDLDGNRVLAKDGLANNASYPRPTFLRYCFLVVASGTGGTVVKDTGTRLAAFEAETANPHYDPGMRDVAIITTPARAPDVQSPSRGVQQLAAPLQEAPASGTVFGNWPRSTTLVWDSVPGAESYSVEIAVLMPGQHCSSISNIDRTVTGLAESAYSFVFIGAQPGCWRVWADDRQGRHGSKSTWWEFVYTRW